MSEDKNLCPFLLMANSNLFPKAKTLSEFQRFKGEIIKLSNCIEFDCHFYGANKTCKISQLANIEDISLNLQKKNNF
ncbi:hypothetical protein [Orenia marismortui]|uniref:Uncharacterized protein n=1 Tax=Orenia marismortui TaxID=46469 RepID=A0A4R8GYS7_9FIRM|nr:hypothetical protein [Orenia marismortui]TDX51687.1 hypothetical protein C7959_11183 [Orenia marismortui]